jgi:hypothetical protein
MIVKGPTTWHHLAGRPLWVPGPWRGGDEVDRGGNTRPRGVGWSHSDERLVRTVGVHRGRRAVVC